MPESKAGVVPCPGGGRASAMKLVWDVLADRCVRGMGGAFDHLQDRKVPMSEISGTISISYVISIAFS